MRVRSCWSSSLKGEANTDQVENRMMDSRSKYSKSANSKSLATLRTKKNCDNCTYVLMMAPGPLMKRLLSKLQAQQSEPRKNQSLIGNQHQFSSQLIQPVCSTVAWSKKFLHPVHPYSSSQFV